MDHTPEHGSGSVSGSTKRLRGVVISISSLVSLCAKKASRVSKKLKTKATNNNINKDSIMTPLRAALPKRLLTSISNKAITYINKKKINGKEDDFGDGGVWQRAILMGDKCQPLDFSGVIYYDSKGKQLSEVPPRSPRASPSPVYLAR